MIGRQEGRKVVLPISLLILYRGLYNKGDDNDDNCHLLGIYYMPRTMLSALHTFPDLILTTNVEGRCYYY